MHSKITTDISICQTENGFFQDELIKIWQMLLKIRFSPGS